MASKKTRPRKVPITLETLQAADEYAGKVRIRPACVTRFHPATDFHGSRVSAKHCNTNKRVTIPWDSGLDSYANHLAAAKKLLGTDDLNVCSNYHGGYTVMAREVAAMS